MHRAAKLFVHTWAEVRTSILSSPARRGFFALVLILLILLAEGCSSSSPRFRPRSDGTVTRESTPVARNGRRFATKEAEEEKKEDDKRPAPEVIEKITSGERSFTREKNEALAPLDQSRMMREISRFMGVPYRLGGEDMQGMDCSGYTMVVFRNSMKRSLPRTSELQSAVGSSVSVTDLKFGDLVFFNTTGQRASHVGIYIGDDLFAHASVSLGVTISSLRSTYFEKRYESARRVFE